MTKLVIIFSLLLFITACGGGGGGKSNKQASVVSKSEISSSTGANASQPNSSQSSSVTTSSSVGSSINSSTVTSSSSSVIAGSILSLSECDDIEIPEEFSSDYTIIGTTLHIDYDHIPVNDFNSCALKIFTDVFYADDQHVYYRRTRIPNMDIHSVTLFDGKFIRDSKNVYGRSSSEQIPSLISNDSPNFVKVGDQYYKDSRYVYYSNYKLLGADPTTFEMVDHYLFKDKSHYWVNGLRLPASFKNLSTIAHNFFTDGNKIYSLNGNEEKRLKLGDIEDIGHNYAKTPFGVYFEGTKLAMDFSLDTVEAISPTYLKDENYVYINYFHSVAKVFGADPSGASVITKKYPGREDESFLVSGEKIFSYASQLPTSDINFEIVNAFYKDSTQVFDSYGVIKDADPDSFTALSYSYSKDADSVFYSRDLLPYADANTFVDLGGGFAKDKDHVYYGGGLIAEADPATFVAYPDEIGKDKKNVYRQGAIVKNVEVDSFKYIGDELFKDEHNLFTYNQVNIPGNLVYLNEYFYLNDQDQVIDDEGTVQTHIDSASFSDLHNGFFADKNGIYDSQLKLVTQDVDNFSIMGSVGDRVLVKDASSVISLVEESRLVLDAIDTDTATLLYGGLIIDSSSLFYLTYSGLVKIQGIEVDALQTIASEIITDGINIVSPQGTLINADPNSFIPFINLHSRRTYAVDNDQVFYNWEPIAVDFATFEIIDNGYYSFDTNDYYYHSKKLNVGNVDTHKIFYSTHYSGNPYLVLPSSVFYDGQVVASADPATFSTVGQYGKDLNNVYFENEIVEWKNESGSMIFADTATFRRINTVYADKSNIYLDFGERVAFTNVNVDSFSNVAYHYYTDNTFIYYWGNEPQKMTADLSSFEPINYSYAKDENSVYFGVDTILNADPLSFKILDYSYNRDSDNIFYRADTVLADPDTFQTLGNSYGKDINNVYFEGKSIPEADTSTFRHLNYSCMRDKDHVFFYGKIVVGADPDTYGCT
ncbi:MAG TPA: DKNYY domain-containing protein [Cellvibrio sp.]|nr:DKNYY domain-containing protein [Cellvibrio sp.]